jgi:parallel beta-helix repeat protein
LSNERLQRVVMVGLAIGVLIIVIISAGVFLFAADWLLSSPMDDGMTIHSDSDFKKQGFPGSGTIEDPYIIAGYSFKKKWEGISVRDTTQHFVITDCTFKECYEGIRLENVGAGTATIANNSITYGYTPEVGPNAGIVVESSDSVLIFNNTISLAGIYGIYCVNSEACNINSNSISLHIEGIELDDCIASIIANNTLYQNSHAINCLHSNFVIITDNICEENDYSGITVAVSDSALVSNNKCFYNFGPGDGDGIVIVMSSNSTIANNEITYHEYGIRALGTTSCQYTQNLLRKNSDYGIGLVPESVGPMSQHNTVFLNIFIDNNPNGTSQALDDGVSNVWFDNATNEGNYWSDWQGSGSYLIEGLASSSDPFPLSELPIALKDIISASIYIDST